MRNVECGVRDRTRVKGRLIAAILVTALAWAVPAVYAAEPLGKRIVLENGMVLLLSEKHELPVVTVSMAIKAGGVVEPADKPGLASITASLLTQGTKSRTANQISREIDFIGGSLSVSGGDDFASANLRVLKKDIGAGFDLLADVLMNPVFDQKEI
ncbi:MAG: putative Peptidase domain protein, involved in ppq synthesis (ppqG), partial [Nitrospirae bacterium]|nr:putative Peptidase domain protein, involved in ppq synthesis (ppqG) [Nitrospirota bacterium]